MSSSRRFIAVTILLLALGGWGIAGTDAEQAPSPQPVDIPATATRLEGIPTVRIDAAETGTTRQVLDPAEAARERLTVSIRDGQYYWTSRGNRLLRWNSAGEYTYLSSDPGHYIRFTRLNDRIAYVEHVDAGDRSTTWWGELRIVVGKHDR